MFKAYHSDQLQIPIISIHSYIKIWYLQFNQKKKKKIFTTIIDPPWIEAKFLIYIYKRERESNDIELLKSANKKHITVIIIKSPESPWIHTSKDDIYNNNWSSKNWKDASNIYIYIYRAMKLSIRSQQIRSISQSQTQMKVIK